MNLRPLKIPENGHFQGFLRPGEHSQIIISYLILSTNLGDFWGTGNQYDAWQQERYVGSPAGVETEYFGGERRTRRLEKADHRDVGISGQPTNRGLGIR